MTAVIGSACIFAGFAVFGWACWRAGVERGIAECENEHTLALRLAALARDEERRQDRAEVLSEALGLMGQKWAHPSNPRFVIDLADKDGGSDA